jgi:hypothetical protein
MRGAGGAIGPPGPRAAAISRRVVTQFSPSEHFAGKEAALVITRSRLDVCSPRKPSISLMITLTGCRPCWGAQDPCPTAGKPSKAANAARIA